MRYHSVLKPLFVMHNFGRSINNDVEKTEPLIIYSSNGCPICLNNWQDKHYFQRAFPTLFAFRGCGHLAKRKTSISLKV